jgi:hypothetical protein
MLSVIVEKRDGIVFDTAASLRYKQHQEWPWLALYSTLVPCSPEDLSQVWVCYALGISERGISTMLA